MSSDSSVSTNSSNVSRFLGEENLIDSLFYICDDNRSGKVAVSKILDYLRGITETSDDSEANMDILSSILDPDNCDPEIDLEAYRVGTSVWIERIRIQELEVSGCDMWSANVDVFSNSVPSSPVIVRPLVNKLLQLHRLHPPSGLPSPLKPIQLFDNSPLIPTSPKLDESSPASDTDGASWNKIADLEYKNRRLVEEANCLKNQLEQSEDMTANLTSEVERLKDEVKNHVLAIERLNEFRSENEDLKALLASSETERKRLQSELAMVEKEYTSLEKHQMDVTYQLSTTQSELNQLQKEHDQANRSLCEAKNIFQETRIKSEIQLAQLAMKSAQVADLQSLVSEMNSINKSLRKEKNDLEIHLVETVQEMNASRHHSPLSEVSQGADGECPVDSDEEIMPLRLDLQTTSTPACRRSMWSELEHSLLLDEPCQPSPLCDKEMDRILLANIKPLMQELSVIVSPETNMPHELGFDDGIIQANSGMGDKVKHVNESFMINDSRIYKYTAMLKKLYELYKKKEKQHGDIQRALEADVKTFTTSLDELKAVLVEENRKFVVMKKQLEESDHQVELQRAHIKELECVKKELSSKYDAVQEDLGHTREELALSLTHEKRRLLSIQSALSASSFGQNSQGRDYWRLLHGDVETGAFTDSQDASLAVSADSLRDQVAMEIESLKSQLVRSQAALQALQNRGFPLSPAVRDTDPDIRNNNGTALFEALTLSDLYDGNRSSAGKTDSNSCPHLDRRLNTCSTQTDSKNGTASRAIKRRAPHVKNNRYTTHNSSTGSSTSGVDVCSGSSDIHATYGRKNMVSMIDGSGTDDPENSRSRLRTPSFNRAIERGPSGDSSNFSCDTTDPASTSPDLSPDHSNPPKCPGHGHLESPRRQILNPPVQSGTQLPSDCETLPAQCDESRNVVFDAGVFVGPMPEDDITSVPLITADIGESPRTRRLSTLVEESEQDVDEIHSLRQLRLPRDRLPPLYSSKTPPQYRLPPAYPEALKSRSRDVSHRSGYVQRSRSLSPNNYDNHEQMPWTCAMKQSISLPTSPNVASGHVTYEPHTSITTETCSHENKMVENVLNIEDRKDMVANKVSDNFDFDKSAEKVNEVKVNECIGITGFKVTESTEKPKEVNISESTEKVEDIKVNESTEKVDLEFKQDDKSTAMLKERRKSLKNMKLSSSNQINDNNKDLVGMGEAAMLLGTRESCRVENVPDTLDQLPGQPSSDSEGNSSKRPGLCKQRTLAEISEVMSTDKFSDEHPTSIGGAVSHTDDQHKPTEGVDSTEDAPKPKAFPSLSDVFLRKMGVLPGMRDKTSDDQTPESQIEERYNQLALAFKTDKLTLDKRLELHQRARDIAEQNIDLEMSGVKDALKVLDPLCKDSKSRDVFSSIQHHVDILVQSTTRMSSRAEVLGAVQQERRISDVIEVMILHVENLKLSLEREHAELEQTRRMLGETRAMGGGGDAESMRKCLSLSGQVGAKDSKVKLQDLLTESIRKASEAIIHSKPIRRASLALGINPVLLEKSPLKRAVSFKTSPSKLSPGGANHLTVVPEDRDSVTDARSDSEPDRSDIADPHPSDAPNLAALRPSDRLDLAAPRPSAIIELSDLARLQQMAQSSSSFSDEEDEEFIEPSDDSSSVIERVVELWPSWKQWVRHLRYTAAGLLFLVGVFMLLATLMPRGSATVNRGVYGWTALEHALWPYLELKYTGLPPT